MQHELLSRQSAFKECETITAWQKQFVRSSVATQMRFKCICIVGGTCQGKTQKAMSIFGPKSTLKVTCGNCPPNTVPSLIGFDRLKHRAIVWDEIRFDQVLAQRELFQSNAYWQTLGQSNCNAFAYSVWMYSVAMILSTNYWDLDSESLSPSDKEWLEGNVLVTSVPSGDKWYID